MTQLQELNSLQTWIKAAADLNSLRLKNSPPRLTRPVGLWENSNRTNARYLGPRQIIKRVSQYGKLYVNSLEELAGILDRLETDLLTKEQILPIYATPEPGALLVGHMRAVQLEVRESETLAVPFTITYQAAYSGQMAVRAPNAVFVGNRTDYIEPEGAE